MLMMTIAFISIFAAVLITMIGVGVQNEGGHYMVTRPTTFVKGFSAVTNIVFAYCK